MSYIGPPCTSELVDRLLRLRLSFTLDLFAALDHDRIAHRCNQRAAGEAERHGVQLAEIVEYEVRPWRVGEGYVRPGEPADGLNVWATYRVRLPAEQRPGVPSSGRGDDRAGGSDDRA